MYNTTVIKLYADSMAMIIWGDIIPSTGDYDTVKSNPSSVDDPSTHVMKYSSYQLSMSVVFNLKYILG